METTLIRLMVSYDSDEDQNYANSCIRTAERLLSDRYGGVTRYEDASGVWFSQQTGRHADPVTVLESACIGDDFDPDHLEEIQRYLSDALEQEAVLAYTEQIETHMYEG